MLTFLNGSFFALNGDLAIGAYLRYSDVGRIGEALEVAREREVEGRAGEIDLRVVEQRGDMSIVGVVALGKPHRHL